MAKESAFRDIRLIAQEMDPAFEPSSPQYCHIRSRQLEGSFPGDAMDGVWPVTAARVNRGWGAVLESDWPYACAPDNWPPPEPTGLDEKAKPLRCHHYQRVRSSHDCRVLLGHGISVPAAFDITEDWFTVDHGAIEMPPEDALNVGSHQVCIVGFDLIHQFFRFKNSWGSEWGENGGGYLPFRYFDKYLVSSWAGHSFGLFPHYFDTQQREQLLWGMPDFLGHSRHGGDVIHGREIFDGATDQRLAWLFAVHREGFLDVEDFFVRPEFRKQGYGNQLVDMLCELRDTVECPIRLWITHADWTEGNRELICKFAEKLSLTLFDSPFRWSPAVLATAPPSSVRGRETNEAQRISTWKVAGKKQRVAKPKRFVVTPTLPLG